MTIPVAFSPPNLDFGGVFPGTSGPDISVDPSLGPPAISFRGGVGIKAVPADAQITAIIEGDTTHFAVRDIIVMEWVLEPVDPSELPHGHHGPLPKVKVLEQVAQSDGTMPLSVKKNQFVLVRVEYRALHVEGTFTATLSINGDTWNPIRVPLSLFLGGVVTTFDVTQVQIVQGTQMTVPMTLASIAGPAVDVAYQQSPLLLDTGVVISTNNVHVEGKQVAHAVLSLTAQMDAPVGPNTLFVDQVAFNHRLGLLLPVNIVPHPNADLELEQAVRDIDQFYNENHGILTVGTPKGPVHRIAEETFQQDYAFGSIIKPKGQPFDVIRRHVSIEIAAIRCFGTDDPGNGDEPYLITTVYKIDPSEGENGEVTKNIGPLDNFHVKSGDVFFQAQQLANNMTVAGDGEIRIHISLWDQEILGNYDDVKKKASLAAQGAIAAGLAALGGQIGIGAAVLGKLAGFLDSVGDAVGGIVADVFGDDLIEQHDFIVNKDFLLKLEQDPNSLTRGSDSIPGETFNFPPLPDYPENDSPAGHSWLFDGGDGGGQYRVFFRISLV